MSQEKKRIHKKKQLHKVKHNFIPAVVIVIGLLLLIGSIVYVMWRNHNSLSNKLNRAYSNAQEYYADGHLDKAIEQLEYYCANEPKDETTKLLLVKWYEQDDQISKRDRLINSIITSKKIDDNQLSAIRKTCSLYGSDSPVIRIDPMVGFTSNVKLSFYGERINISGFVDGGIEDTYADLSDDKSKRTTEWIPVDATRKSLILCGDFNCSIWQFMDKNNRIHRIIDDNTYNDYTSVSLNKQSFSKVDIPENAVSFRVTFFNKGISDFPKEDNILIYYGAIPEGYSSMDIVEWELPDLNEDEYLVYSQGEIKQYKAGDLVRCMSVETPEFYTGMTLSMDGEVCGLVTVSCQEDNNGPQKENDITAQYGVRINTSNGIPVCERLGDSRGMHFDYIIDNVWAGQAERNDYDSAYPWSEMRLCNLYEGKVIYENDAIFSKDGSNGNVMVEIPKFFVKRICGEGYEEIWISGTQYEGYSLDPVFMVNGVEKDCVYVGAYLSSERDGKLQSISGAYPTVMINYGEVLEETRNNGEGFTEANYFLYSAIQKLFLIETATLDSTSLFAGETDLYFYSTDPDISKTGIAVESENQTNSIVVNDVGATRKLEIGTSVIIMNIDDEWESYDRTCTENLREVVGRTKKDGYYSIEVSGDPFDVVENKTLIASFPSLTGKTDGLLYCTGVYQKNNGRFGFKYRNIENIYGGSLVMLDSDAYIQDQTFCFVDQYGELVQLSAEIPIQKVTLNVDENGYRSGNVNCIKKMSYDEKYPSVMIPVEVGAGSYTYYCDYFFNSDTGLEKKKYICMGSADDNRRIGGIFQFRAVVTSLGSSSKFMSGRIMCR